MPRLLTALLVLAVSAGAQELTPEALERAERAHQVLEQKTPSAGEIAESITADAAELRPGQRVEAAGHAQQLH
jgi:hypothetical protein